MIIPHGIRHLPKTLRMKHLRRCAPLYDNGFSETIARQQHCIDALYSLFDLIEVRSELRRLRCFFLRQNHLLEFNAQIKNKTPVI